MLSCGWFLLLAIIRPAVFGSNWTPLTYYTYETRQLVSEDVVIWGTTEGKTEANCSIICGLMFNQSKSCNSYVFKRNLSRCEFYRLVSEQHEAVSSSSNKTVIRVNRTLENCDGQNCAEYDVNTTAQISTSSFPPAMDRIVYAGLAFSYQSSTLVACGGAQLAPPGYIIKDKSCWMIKLAKPGIKSWQGPFNMSMARGTPGMVAVHNKAYIIGGLILDSSDETNNFVEVLDITTGSVSIVSNASYPYSTGGLYFACLLPLTDENNFVITGGEEYHISGYTTAKQFAQVMKYHTDTGTFQAMPSLPNTRSYHGCDSIKSGSSRTIVVYGGNRHTGYYYEPFVAYDDILFLDLDNQNQGWRAIPGSKLSQAMKFINGGVIKHLTATSCDMMFVTFDEVQAFKLVACKSNYTWTSTLVYPNSPNRYSLFVPVGINTMSPCV